MHLEGRLFQTFRQTNPSVDNMNLPQKLTTNQHQDNRGEHKLIASCLNLGTNIIIMMVWSKTKATEFISFHQSFLVANPQWCPLRAEQADISFHFISQSRDSRLSQPSGEKKPSRKIYTRKIKVNQASRALGSTASWSSQCSCQL